MWLVTVYISIPLRSDLIQIQNRRRNWKDWISIPLRSDLILCLLFFLLLFLYFNPIKVWFNPWYFASMIAYVFISIPLRSDLIWRYKIISKARELYFNPIKVWFNLNNTIKIEQTIIHFNPIKVWFNPVKILLNKFHTGISIPLRSDLITDSYKCLITIT